MIVCARACVYLFVLTRKLQSGEIKDAVKVEEEVKTILLEVSKRRSGMSISQPTADRGSQLVTWYDTMLTVHYG